MIAIYIPGRDPANEETLRSLGCGPLLDKTVAAMKIDAAVEGPDGEPGQLFYLEQPGSDRKPITAVDRNTQTWTEAAADGELKPGRYWLGYWTEAPPKPTELERVDLVDGMAVELADGNLWVIPVADFFPKRLVLDRDTGEEKEEVFGKDRAFVEEANQLFNHFLSADFQKLVKQELVVKIPDGLRFAAKALAVNYRVNVDLVHALGLIGGHQAFDVARVATGLALVDEANQKKTALTALST